jgi:hypothetical protein
VDTCVSAVLDEGYDDIRPILGEVSRVEDLEIVLVAMCGIGVAWTEPVDINVSRNGREIIAPDGVDINSLRKARALALLNNWSVVDVDDSIPVDELWDMLKSHRP